MLDQNYYADDKKDRELDEPSQSHRGYVDLRYVNLVTLPEGTKEVTLFLENKQKFVMRFGQSSEAKKWRDELYKVIVRLHKGSDGLKEDPGLSPLSPGRKPGMVASPAAGNAGGNQRGTGGGNGGQRGLSPGAVAGSDSDGEEDSGDEESLAGFLLLRAWGGLGLFFLVASMVGICPVPTLDFWFFKTFILSGVLHASVLALAALAAAISLAALSLAKGKTQRSLFAVSGAAFGASVAFLALPALVAVPLASSLPARTADFLAAAKLRPALPRSHDPAAGGREGWPLAALDASEFFADPPCALANVWEYFAHTSEITYKRIPAAPLASTSPLDDWSGFGGLSGRNDTQDGLRLAIFGTGAGSEEAREAGECAADEGGEGGGACKSLRPVLVSLHGGGWFRGSLYDGLQCYLPAALGEGFAVLAAEYRSGSAGWKGRDMVEDALDLLAWIGEHGSAHGLDKTKVVVMGGSAGAHVGLMASYIANARASEEGGGPTVQGVVARYGAVGDLAAAYAEPKALPRGLGDALAKAKHKYLHAGRALRVRGWDERAALDHVAAPHGAAAATAEELSWLSVVTHAGPHSPPTIVLHCAQDEFYDASTHAGGLKRSLDAAGTPYLLLTPRLHSHGCDIGSTAPFQLLRFALVRLLAAVKVQAEPQ